MRRLLLLTPSELTRDPRARRAAATARDRGLDVTGLSGQLSGEGAIPLEGVSVVRLGGERVASRLRAAGLGGMRRNRASVRELRGLYRLLRLARLTIGLLRAGRQLGSFDIVHANDFETLPAGWLLAKRSHARLVYDAHELYTAQEPDPPRIHRLLAGRLEAALARQADAVVTVSAPMAGELERRLGLRTTPFAVLSCPERVDDVSPDSRSGPLHAVYQGAMGPGRMLADLLVAAEHAPGVDLTLRVAGVDRGELGRIVGERELANVHVVEPVSPDRLVEALHGFEVGVVINRPVTRNDELVFPNKLFEYMMAGLAVAVPRLPVMAAFVEEEGIGMAYEAGRPESLASSLTELGRDRPRLMAMRERARAIALQRFNAEVQSETLARAWGLGAPTATPLDRRRPDPGARGRG